MPIAELPWHPYAEIFPFRAGDSLVALADSIAKLGQFEPIVKYQGKVLEGRRRQTACIMRGIQPIYREFGDRPSDGSDPLEFSYAVNYHRRDDMTPAEKYDAAKKYATFKFGENQHTGKHKGQGAHACAPSKTQAEAAKKFGISVRQIQLANKVMEKGSPELQQAFRANEITIRDAAAIVDEPPELQAKAIEAVKEKKTKTARAAVAIAKGPQPEDVGKIARELEALIQRVERINTKDAKRHTRLMMALRQALAILGKL